MAYRRILRALPPLLSVIALMAAAAVVITGVGDPASAPARAAPCPLGQIADPNGTCVIPLCPIGQIPDISGRCVSLLCPIGQTRDSSGNCQVPSCPSGQTRDPSGSCVEVGCPSGQTRDPSGSCQVPSCPSGQTRDPSGTCQPAAFAYRSELRPGATLYSLTKFSDSRRYAWP